MKTTRAQLIDQLATDLPSVTVWPSIARIALVWLGMALVTSILLILVSGPFRPGAFAQLITVPRFTIEMLLGTGTVAVLALLAVRMTIPGLAKPLAPACLLALVWLSTYLTGLWSPVLETGMTGKREHCFYEVYLYGLPVMAAVLYRFRQAYVTRGYLTGFAVGLCSGLVPGLIMQLACMYDAVHALSFHFFPALLLGVTGAASGLLLTGRHRQQK